jgi:hypothetical protein
MPAEMVFGLKNYVSRVEYRLDNETPAWDTIPNEIDEVEWWI